MWMVANYMKIRIQQWLNILVKSTKLNVNCLGVILKLWFKYDDAMILLAVDITLSKVRETDRVFWSKTQFQNPKLQVNRNPIQGRSIHQNVYIQRLVIFFPMAEDVNRGLSALVCCTRPKLAIATRHNINSKKNLQYIYIYPNRPRPKQLNRLLWFIIAFRLAQTPLQLVCWYQVVFFLKKTQINMTWVDDLLICKFKDFSISSCKCVYQSQTTRSKARQTLATTHSGISRAPRRAAIS